MSKDYINFVVSSHTLYDRYYDDWKLCLNSWYGGTEYKNARYLRAYAVDMATPGETINTYITGDDGMPMGRSQARLQIGHSTYEANRDSDIMTGNFYKEKLDNTPLYNYVKLIAAEYNALLFRNPPQRYVGDSTEAEKFLKDVSGEGESINEFMSQVDLYTTVMGVCHVTCIKPIGSDIPRWRIHTPLDVTNWNYAYDIDGNLVLTDVVILLEKNDTHSVYRYFTRSEIHTIFVGADDEDYVPPIEDKRLEKIDDNVYRIVQPNELGYVPMQTFYQSTKIYNNIGTTVVQDVAQIQRSIYGDMAEIYSAITYSAHPTLIVDEQTDQLNDGAVGGEPGSIVKVQNSLTGEPNYVFEFKSPSLDSITQIRELVDNKVQKLSQIAMLRSEDLIKAANSGAQIEVYDDKLSAMVRRKATNLENGEAKLWEIWYDWLNMLVPEDFSISYNRQYNRRALEIELKEVELMMATLDKYELLIEGPEEPEDKKEYKKEEYTVAPMPANGTACPVATQDIAVNLANRQNAIDTANYGPLNPAQPNDAFWQALADKWSVSVEEAKKSRCGNCAAFNITANTKACIQQGLAAGGATGDEWETVGAGDLGYCEAFDFKCASARTCDAWVGGGPITDANGMEIEIEEYESEEDEAEYGLTPEQYKEYEEFKTNARNKIRERLEQLFNASTTANGF